jgi:hypothetical protein
MNNNRKKYEKIVEKENKEKGIFKETLRIILLLTIIHMIIKIDEKSVLGLILICLLYITIFIIFLRYLIFRFKNKYANVTLSRKILDIGLLIFFIFFSINFKNKNFYKITIIKNYCIEMKNIRKIIENTENFNVNGKKLKESDKIKKWLLNNTNLFKILGYQIESNIWEKNNEKMKIFKPNLLLKNDKNEELKMEVIAVSDGNKCQMGTIEMEVMKGYHISLKEILEEKNQTECEILRKYVD